MPRKSTEPPQLSVEDLSLPRTMVQRLAKGVLPANTQIQKDALVAISKSATVFVSYISSRANENALAANKKTIQPKDVLEAMQDLEFAEFVDRLEGELHKFTTVQNDKRNSYRRKVREQQIAAKASAASEHLASNSQDSPNAKKGDDEPATKKAKVDADADEGDEDEDEDMDDTGDIGDQDEEEDDVEEDEEEDEDDGEGGSGDDDLVEDPLEAKDGEDPDDESGEESD